MGPRGARLAHVRPSAEHDGVRVRAFQGTTGILLALDVDDDRRDGLLGFAVQRTDLLTGRRRWLENLLVFKGPASSRADYPTGALDPPSSLMGAVPTALLPECPPSRSSSGRGRDETDSGRGSR